MKNIIFAVQNLILTTVINKEKSSSLFQKRSTSGGSTFATHTEHTPIFNTIHIIVAVIGIVVAIAVAIIIFILYKRRRKQSYLKRDVENNRMTESTDISIQQTIINRFASDFDNHVEAPKPVVTHVEDVSPLMQQYQLQLKLLQQEREKQQHSNLKPIQHHTSSSSSSKTSSPTSLLPPPPYQP
ncbi:uncharacterized protein BX663DRAFT_497116 [Cokeromyces recurvatus]|uniref:uncharacterized protein n=1 Tax=Cokeromyces recurvatus TaxID=90255 RepID=UPI00221FF6DD|nr:uncharacterized protein BX663DRAFT_497116 [Cokeromyces recurvatus]KAI7906621.1 hypothetical protein BX663DRAFT_497116 [Cokeromyces recurvatus]